MRAAVAAAQEVSSTFGATPANLPTAQTPSHVLNLLAPLIRWTGQLLRTGPEDEVPPIHVDEDYRQSLIQLMKLFPYSLQHLELIGAGPAELIQAGFAARQLREAGFSWNALRGAGLTLRELRHAGYPAEDFLSGAVDLRELRSLGFSARELRESLGPTAARELRAAGFTATQLKLADFDAWQLEEAGYSIPEILDAGFCAQQMHYTSLSADGMRDAGFGAKELWEAGYSRRQLEFQFTEEELNEAGIGEREDEAELRQVGLLENSRPKSRPEDSGLSSLSTEQVSQVALQYPWG